MQTTTTVTEREYDEQGRVVKETTTVTTWDDVTQVAPYTPPPPYRPYYPSTPGWWQNPIVTWCENATSMAADTGANLILFTGGKDAS